MAEDNNIGSTDDILSSKSENLRPVSDTEKLQIIFFIICIITTISLFINYGNSKKIDLIHSEVIQLLDDKISDVTESFTITEGKISVATERLSIIEDKIFAATEKSTTTEDKIATLTKKLTITEENISGVAEKFAMTEFDNNQSINELEQSQLVFLNDFKLSINNQTALINRALGKVLPISLPESTKQTFEKIKTNLHNVEQWPSSVEAIKNLSQKHEHIFNDLPVWIQYEILPDVSVTRWELTALLAINEGTKINGSNDTASEYLRNTADILLQQPVNTNPIFEKRLYEVYKRVEKDYEKNQLDSVHAKAKNALEIGNNITDALNDLSDYNDNKSQLYKKDLKRKLTVGLLNEEFLRLNDILKNTREIQESELKQYSLEQVYNTFLGIEYKAVIAKIDNEALYADIKLVKDGLLTEIENLRKDKIKQNKDILKNYQTNAIHQLQEFQRIYLNENLSKSITNVIQSFKNPIHPYNWEQLNHTPEVIKDIKIFTGVHIDSYVISQKQQKALYKKFFGTGDTLSIEYAKKLFKETTDIFEYKDDLISAIIREGMIKYLSRINTNLLELPVSNIYRKFYSRSFEILNEKDQWKVMTAFVEANKLVL